jgi:two-component system, OmpR family, alkaline phosphatase synthesis response regulator PhoP
MTAPPPVPTGTPAVHVLVVDDELPIVELVRGYLRHEGWEVLTVADGPAAIAAVREHAPDVVVLDLMLPGLDGVEVCRQLRTFSDVYVIMLTARGEEIDRVVGLSVGADDYLVKPFSPRELVARIKALLRRPRPPAISKNAQVVGDLIVDIARRKATVAGRDLALTAVEFDLLATLARDPGLVVTRQGLLDQVWGPDYFGDDHVLDVHVAKLRRKLAADGTGADLIETIRGIGFRLKEQA